MMETNDNNNNVTYDITNDNNNSNNNVNDNDKNGVRKKADIFMAFIDFLYFISESLGFVFQEIYFMLFGYPIKSLTKDIALITGGGGGLGRLLALRLSELGSKVVVWDINQKGIKETTEMIRQMGGFCQGYVVDISNRDEVYKAADIVKRDIGDISILINNAGVVSGTHLLDTPDNLIERSFKVNVMAHFWTTKAFLPIMLENRVGHIVTIASLAGHVGITKLVDYCGSKFAAVGFDEALRLELEVLGHENIKTTCICPYFLQHTGMFDDVYARWVPTLNSKVVAERIILAIQRNEKIAIIPGFMKYLLALKWIFPWGCTAGLLKRLVPDASPNGFNKTKLALDGKIGKLLSLAKVKETSPLNNETNRSSLITKASLQMAFDKESKDDTIDDSIKDKSIIEEEYNDGPITTNTLQLEKVNQDINEKVQ